jgi:hypothetical protein
VDRSTLRGKVYVGYQGWFRCPGDGSPENVWSRWLHGKPDPTTAQISDPSNRAWRVDNFPDVSDLDPSSKCAVPNLQINGQQGYVFSSYPKATADTHFRWMRQYGIDGALMQRFVGVIPTYRREGDAVLRNAIASAEKNGRTIIVEYDISGGHAETVFEALKADWAYLTQELRATQSPAYQYENGKPVVSIWGLGVKNRIADPALCKQIVEWFKNEGHATVIGGVATDWAAPSGDSQPDPAWGDVYKALDVVQPWTVGRIKDLKTATDWKDSHLARDVAVTRQNHQGYMPVIYPGFSWHNSKRSDAPGDLPNRIPRLGGQLLWAQAMAARSAGSTMVKIAMFDEVNEGTPIFKLAATKNDAPAEAHFVTMDEDGQSLPSDWYLRVASAIAAVFHGQAPVSATLPSDLKAPSSR